VSGLSAVHSPTQLHIQIHLHRSHLHTSSLIRMCYVILLRAATAGAGPIAFTTSNKVVVSGVTCGSACTVSFANSQVRRSPLLLQALIQVVCVQDIFIADTMAEGSVSLTGVTASIKNTSVCK
jgi:hypothetical protein